MNNIFTRASFFSNSTFIFIAHFFRGLAGAYMNPRKVSLFVHSLFVHSLVYPIPYSLNFSRGKIFTDFAVF